MKNQSIYLEEMNDNPYSNLKPPTPETEITTQMDLSSRGEPFALPIQPLRSVWGPMPGVIKVRTWYWEQLPVALAPDKD